MSTSSGADTAAPNVPAATGVLTTDVASDDAQLVRSAAAGDAAAFGVLYDRHFTAVYGYVFLRVRDRMEAEDVTSETFMRALRSLHRYEPRAPFAAWLVRIARNLVIDRARGSTRREANERAAATPGSVDPEREALARIEGRELRAALDGLSELQREVLILRFYSDLTTEEVCAVLGKGPSTVRGIQHRAIAALRRSMAGAA
jgi:RNA polymerase sigma-70 factor (ECF subfamily)